MSGKDILERKVSVQLARKPDAEAPKSSDDATAQRKRSTGRGRGGRGRGRGGRAAGGRTKSGDEATPTEAPPTDEVLPLADKTNEVNQAPLITDESAVKSKKTREPKQRGPPEDGIASTTKVMVANLPYDLTEEKVSFLFTLLQSRSNTAFSSRNSSLSTSLSPPRLLFDRSQDS